jgi:hypothetical protein
MNWVPGFCGGQGTEHVPGAEAPGFWVAVVSGLKPGPISEARAEASQRQERKRIPPPSTALRVRNDKQEGGGMTNKEGWNGGG